MAVVAFRTRAHTLAPAATLADLVARIHTTHLACDITLTKGDRIRRYVLWADAPGRLVGEVWFGRCRHRVTRASLVHRARMIAHQFKRELQDLVRDGWIESGP